MCEGVTRGTTQAYWPQIFFYLIFISIFEFTDGCEMMHKA